MKTGTLTSALTVAGRQYEGWRERWNDDPAGTRADLVSRDDGDDIGAVACRLILQRLEAVDECEHAGHEWAPAGGGLEVCVRCEAEKWAPDDGVEGWMGYPITMDDRAYEIHRNACAKGFWDHRTIALPEDPSEPRYAPARTVPNPSIDAEKLALIHSEVSEALEAHRDGDMDHVAEELADVIIRVLDFAQAHGMSMERAVAQKMAKNLERPAGHGRQW